MIGIFKTFFTTYTMKIGDLEKHVFSDNPCLLAVIFDLIYIETKPHISDSSRDGVNTIGLYKGFPVTCLYYL